MAEFSRDVIGLALYPYQVEIADYICQVVAGRRTEDITVEMARQSGKNEISAQVEAATLARYGQRGGVIVKAAPTWSPQIVRSKHRLESRALAIARKLRFLRFRGREGYIVQCGNAAINFLSGKPTANVVGDTASLLMEIDESQDFDAGKFDKDFSPMRASTGAPAVFYGTTWSDATLLERAKTAIAEGRVAGRIFKVPWERAAEDNPRYGQFVEREINRLGVEHPLIRTQYLLLPIEEQGRLLKNWQLRQMIGDHPRGRKRTNEAEIVAGLDFAGADEQVSEMISLSERTGRDSVALSIGQVDWVVIAAGIVEPVVKILDRYEWVNVHPTSLHTTLHKILNDDWRVDRLHCDATGIGEVPTAYLARALGGQRVAAIKFDSAWTTQSRLCFQYAASVNGSRLLDFAPAEGVDPLLVAGQELPPASEVDRHIWWQRGHARLETRAGQKVRAYVPDNEGHDDLLVAELLMLDAAYAGGVSGWAAWARRQLDQMEGAAHAA
jgi:hypothetical protein